MADNEFDTTGAVSAYLNDKSLGVKSAVNVALGANPDYEAELRKVSRATGVPIDSARAFPDEAKRQAQFNAINFDTLTRQFPRTAAFLSGVDNAKVAHDDIDNLSATEQVLGFLKGSGGALLSAVPAFNEGAWGIAQSAAELGSQYITGPLNGKLLPEDPLARAADFFSRQRQASIATKDSLMPKSEGNVGAGWYSGLQSFGQSALSLPLAVISGNPELALAPMVGTVGGQAYGQARDQGVSVPDALAFGTSQAAIEYATEKLPVHMLLKDLKAGSGWLKTLGHQAMSEVPGEQAATALQDLNEWAALPENKDKTFKDYLAARPDAAVQTLVATLVGVGGNVAVGKGVERAASIINGRTAQAQRAEQGAAALEQLDKLAAASKVRARDADTFEQFIAQATEDSPLQTVFIDAKTLAQSGVADQLAQVSPSVAEQLPAALATGGDIAIPIPEYAARIAGTELGQPLLDHLKTEPGGMSRAEAQVFMQDQANGLQAEVERVLTEKQADDTFKASAENIKTNIKAQLDTAARFTAPVNDAYASMVSNFYAVMGAKLGITPEQLYERYPLKVTSDMNVGMGKDVLGQITPEQAKETNVPVELPSDPVFAEAVGNTQGAEVTPDGLRINLVRYQKPEQEAAQAIRTGVFYLPVGAKTAKHYKHAGKLSTGNAYGGSEEMVGETLIRRPLFVKGATGGKAPEAAYDALKGKGAYQKMRSDVLHFMGASYLNTDDRIYSIEEGLKRYGADPALASEILRNSKAGNTLPYAIQENIVAHAVRDAGYDAVVGYSKGKAGASISEVFDVREQTFPSNVMESEVHEKFLNQSANTYTQDTIDVDGVEPDEFVSDGIEPPHGVKDKGKLSALTERMESADAWIGRPVLGYMDASGGKFALTGSHRIAAANRAGVQIPVVWVDSATTEFQDESGDFLSDVVGTGDDRVLAFLRKAGDNRAADLMQAEINANDEGFTLNQSANTYTQDTVDVDGVTRPTVNQEIPQGTRGFFNPATNTIALLERADLSTFLHESGHFFLQTQFDIAQRIMADGVDSVPGGKQIIDDTNALLKWFGVRDLAEWYSLDVAEWTNYHEQFARGFEAYAFEGKAPSIELQGVFQRFRAWLLNVYKEITRLNVTLTDEVRGVMDRMLASTEQIQLAEQARSMMPLFETAEQAGMTREEFAQYQALGVDATNDAIQDLQARGLRDMQWLTNAKGREIRRLQKQADAKRAEIEMEMRREIMSEPVYRAWKFLTGKADGKTESQTEYEKDFADWKRRREEASNAARKVERDRIVASNPDVTGLKKGQLLARMKKDIDLVVAKVVLDWERANPQPQRPTVDSSIFDTGEQIYGKLNREAVDAMETPTSVISSVKRLRMTAVDGMHPDVVAEMFGFSSGDELVRALAAADKPKDAIQAATDAAMLERFGELATPEAISRAADMAIHNDARARMVATEVNALAKATGQRKVLAKAARDFAEAMIARLKVRDIQPSRYANAESRAGKEADKAMRAGDLTTAAAEKRNQLVQNYATKAAYAAQEEIAKGLRYLKKFDSENVRKGLDADYTDQIDALLDRFDLRTGQSLKDIDKRKSLMEWVNAQREKGLEPDIPDALLNEAARKSYKDMTIEEFRGLVDSVKQIEHIGRLKKKLLTAKDQREYDAIVQSITDSINEHANGRKADTRTPTTNLGRALAGMRRFYTSHIKAATLARVMDGGKDGGPMWEYLIRSANERADSEATRRADATLKLSEILDPVFKQGKMGGKGEFFPSINRSLNRESRIAIALNIGNEGNLQRLLGGEGWTPAQLMPVLESLTADEWAAVQGIWNHFESYRPDIGAKERRIYGKEPEWVEPGSQLLAAIAESKGVDLKGGYYPIKYDPKASQRAEEHNDAESAKRQMQGAYTSATTRRSFTKSRAEEVVGRPLLYTLAGMYQGVNDVIHDLYWHEWLIDANRLMRSHRIDTAIRTQYGPDVKAQFKSWIQDIAGGDSAANAALDQALGYLRQSVSVSGLGFNVVSAIMQPLGLTQSIVRVGAGWIARGTAEYLAGPRDAAKKVNELSEFMRNRNRTRFRELNELRNRVQDQSAAKEFLQGNAYRMMMFMQSTVDVPTWLGAYSKAIADGNAGDRAVQLADQAVIDSQGGGETKDLSAIERGGPAQKLFTVFYSFMNTALNLAITQGMTEKSKAKLASDMILLLVVPAVLGQMLKDAITPGGGDDDKDWLDFVKKAIGAEIDYLFGLFVIAREFAGAAKIATGTSEFAAQGYPGPAGVRMIGDVYKVGQQVGQGEFDLAFLKASIGLSGDLLGLPAAQINRTVTGANALAEGQTDNPAAVVFGYQR